MWHIVPSVRSIPGMNYCLYYQKIVIALLIILSSLTIYNSAISESIPSILILNAYHQGEDWSDKELKGITEVLKEAYPFLVPSIEHLDTKRFPDSDYLLIVKKYLKEKYREKYFDLIITIDNSALNLMLKFGDELFPGCPIVFAGVNGYSPDILKGHTNITGVAEVEDMEGTLKLALNMHPGIKKVLAVHDYTSTGLAVRRDMESIAGKLKDKVTIEYTPEGTIDDLLVQLQALPQDAIVILLTYVTDKSGRIFSREEGTRIITTASPVPVYAMAETRLGHGIVGGVLLEGVEHGKQVAEIALMILAGEKPGTIPVVNSRSVTVFDYNQLVRFKVPINHLSADSQIINLPVSFWTKYKKILVPGSTLFGFLTAIIIILSVSMIRIRRAERVVHESEEKYRGLFLSIRDAILISDIDRTIVDCNPAFIDLFGYSTGEIIGEKTQIIYEKAEHFMEVGRAFREHSLDTPFLITVNLKKKNGEVFPGEGCLFYLKDLKKNVIGHIALIRDISDRKLTEDRLKFQANLLEAVEQAVIVTNPIGEIVYWNPFSEKLYQWSAEEATGRNINDVIPTGSSEENAQEIISKLERGESWSGEFYVQRRDTVRFHAMVTDTPILDENDKLIWIIRVSTDITERRRLENQLQQSQKLESIGTLAGGIAHEFNNHLGIIIGNNELLMDELPKWGAARQRANKIRTASFRASDVVKQLLVFSRRDESEASPMDIGHVVKESLKLIRSFIPANIGIKQTIADDVAPVFGSPTQINQILINLFSNAADAMMHAGGNIQVDLCNEITEGSSTVFHPNMDPGNCVKLMVSDTGAGMDKETLDRIFEPYFTTKEIGKGTGIGLAIVHGIVEKHGGAIAVESVPGRGTTFTILFPAYHGQIEKEIAADFMLPTGNERILLVDDEPMLLELGRQRLERLGYSIQATTDPIEALEMFIAEPDGFDLIITDMAMPHMTGDQLVSEILGIHPGMAAMLCTGNSEKISQEKACEIGFKAIIMKPVDRTELAVNIRKILDEAKR